MSISCADDWFKISQIPASAPNRAERCAEADGKRLKLNIIQIQYVSCFEDEPVWTKAPSDKNLALGKRDMAKSCEKLDF
ncbi:MAG: hypothetical protein DCC75_09935 [Proteobacteria bacterium]|nr:MAG: hypothetical protein DCC75_09935 [Pseudomonadota bacterium]